MDDGQVIIATLVAIVAGAIIFVWALRREDRARIAAGRGMFTLGYSTRTGWMLGAALVGIAVFLMTR